MIRDFYHERWRRRLDAFPTEPRGDAIALARQLWKKYGSAFDTLKSSG